MPVRRWFVPGTVILAFAGCTDHLMQPYPASPPVVQPQTAGVQAMSYDAYGRPVPQRRMSITEPVPAPMQQAAPAPLHEPERIFAAADRIDSADRIDTGSDPYRYTATAGNHREPVNLTSGAREHATGAGRAGDAAITGMTGGHTTTTAAGHSATGGQHWSYAGAEGPEHWGDLSPAFRTCASGKAQSPVDLASASRGAHSELHFNYRQTPLGIRNNGHTVQIDYAPGSWLEIEGMRYDLLQLHVHAPSEHVVNGRTAPMELHLVHQNRHGQLAVVGVMIDAGPVNPLIAAMRAYTPAEGDPVAVPGVHVSAADVLPPRLDYFRYTGSLTTPPCSEGVAWHVLDQPITASPMDIQALAAAMPHNNARPVQALNARRLTLD